MHQYLGSHPLLSGTSPYAAWTAAATQTGSDTSRFIRPIIYNAPLLQVLLYNPEARSLF